MSRESIWIVFLGLDNECVVACFKKLSFEDFLKGGDIRVSFLVACCILLLKMIGLAVT